MADTEYEDKPDSEDRKTGKDRSDFVRFWIESIDAAKKAEEDWRKDASDAVSIYRADNKTDFSRHTEFNIFHANIETTLPAIYNSTPVPDVRRRFGDKDKVAKTVSQLLERCLSFSVDNYDFSETMRQVLFDGLVPGRGVARVRYVPYFTEVQEEPGEEQDQEAPEALEGAANTTEPEANEVFTYEEVSCEYVPYGRFICGPGDTWETVAWVAFEHYLKREEISKLCDDEEKAAAVNLDFKIDATECDENDAKKGDIFRRGRVYEIWDRDEKKVFFIASGYSQDALREEEDPYNLEGFFPVPRPVQPILTPGNLTPVCPYTIYKSLVEELNEITFRIKRLVRQIRVRGGFGAGGADLERLMMADDGELVPLEGLEQWIDGGIEKAITWWPIEPTVKALAQLYQQREQVKQTIYEITGISDIVRGASKASETATAQEIKNQWGSLRIQKMQYDVQRFARDIFRIKAEIIAKKFDPQTIMMISGMQLLPQAQKQMLAQQMQPQPAMPGQPPAPPPQIPEEMQKAMEQPSLEEVFGIMRSDLMRSYRIDIESDSTIRADLTRNQRAMGEFLQGTAQYIAAVGPAVQAGQMPGNVAAEIYTAFARNYKLGKQAEDALDKMGEDAGQPQPPKPDPEAEKAKMQMQIEQQKAQVQQQNDQAKLQLERAKMQMQAEHDQAKMQADMAMQQQKMQFEMELAREKAAQEYQLRMMEVNADIEIKRAVAEQNAQMNYEASQNKMAIAANEAKARKKFNAGLGVNQ